MSRLNDLFSRKQQNILNVYCTAGFPALNDTITVMKSLQEHGADIIELGMPYSDPLADGPVIQQSGLTALQNGMSIPKLFEQLKDFRHEIHIPVVLMGYLNPLLQYGFENFCAKAKEIGIDALIIPDIPIYEYENYFKPIVNRYDLQVIFLVTPETSEERSRLLDKLSTCFLYAVSSSSITGSEQDFSAVDAYLQRLKAMQLKNPILVGFGIKDKETFTSACRLAAGAIIGTAYIKALQQNKDIDETTASFIKSIIE